MSCLLLAAGGPAFAAGTAPLPPKKPQAQAVAVPAPSAVRRPPLRAAPLPPPRPAELGAEDEDMPEPAAAPRLVARTVGPEEGAEAGEGVAPDFAPSPPTRPDAQAPAGAGGPGETPPAGAAREMPAACAALVEEGTIVATLEAPIASKGGCGLDLPVRLSGVRLVDGRLVSLKPASVTGCEVAAATAEWLREDLAPAVAALGSEVTAVTVAASYDCRPRNRVSGARMSEHGLGNALDVGGFELADARVLKVEKGGFPQRLRAAMKESACRRFTTVLGPGSDGYHEDHIHVDLARRRLDIRLCRWNLDAGTVVARKDKPKAKEAAPDAAAAGKGQGGAGQDGAGQDGAGQDGAVPAGAAAKPATGQRAD